MNKFLELTPEDRNLYCRQASERLDISLPAAVIEKDFWVCWTLQILNEIQELNGSITFKGGTSLSKAWGLIERFSEDIDIAISRKVFGQEPPFGPEDAPTNRQRKIRLEELEKRVLRLFETFYCPNSKRKYRNILQSLSNLNPFKREMKSILNLSIQEH